MFKAFAIKIGNTAGDKKLKSLVKNITANYPSFKVEGLTHKHRPNIELQSETTIITDTSFTSVKDVKIRNTEYLTMGYSKNYDISFETKKDLHFAGIPLVKVLDVNKDFDKIITLLATYVSENYALESLVNLILGFREVEAEPAVIVKQYSCFATVNGQPRPYSYKRKR